MINSVSQYLKVRYLLYFFAFIAGWPCIFFVLGWLPNYTINYSLLLIFATIFVVFKVRSQVPQPIQILIGLQIITWMMYSIIYGFDTSYFTRIFMLFITFLFLKIQMSSDKQEFIKTYNFWLTLQTLLGSIGFILVLVGMLKPFFEFSQWDGRPGYFFGLFTTNTYFLGLVRNAGFFDEPGALAFWGIYALLINKLFINNKKVELILIFGLISTVSLAYFVQVAFYLWFFYKERRNKVVFYIISLVFLLKMISSFNEDMDKAIFGRMKFNVEIGTIEGDNRSDIAKETWNIFKTSPIIGKGARNLIGISESKGVFLGANPFVSLASDGILGYLVVCSPFFFLFWLGKYDKRYRYAFWILMLGFLQRPYDCTQLLYPLMSFTIILHSYLQLSKKVGYEKL